MIETPIYTITKEIWNGGLIRLEEPEINLRQVYDKNIILEETEYLDRHSKNIPEWINKFEQLSNTPFDDLPIGLQVEVINYVADHLTREMKVKLLRPTL